MQKNKKNMKLSINRETCIGCGACESLCPKYFKLDDEGKAVPKIKEVSDKDKKAVQEAKDSCPVEAIKLE